MEIFKKIAVCLIRLPNFHRMLFAGAVNDCYWTSWIFILQNMRSLSRKAWNVQKWTCFGSWPLGILCIYKRYRQLCDLKPSRTVLVPTEEKEENWQKILVGCLMLRRKMKLIKHPRFLFCFPQVLSSKQVMNQNKTVVCLNFVFFSSGHYSNTFHY